MSHQSDELIRVLEVVRAHIAKDDAVNPLQLKVGDRDMAITATMIALGTSGSASLIYVDMFMVFTESEADDG